MDTNTTSPIERRIISHTVELRAAGEGGGLGTIYGYAAKFNSPTVLYEDDYEVYTEIIEPGFFDDVLNDDVRCLFNHQNSQIIGRSKAGNLSLSVDATGLLFDCNPPDTTRARDLVEDIRVGNVTQCSFGFETKEQRWVQEEKDGKWFVTRYLVKGKKLWDVGPVTFPAYESTEVSVRSLEEFRKEAEKLKQERNAKTFDVSHFQRELELMQIQ